MSLVDIYGAHDAPQEEVRHEKVQSTKDTSTTSDKGDTEHSVQSQVLKDLNTGDLKDLDIQIKSKKSEEQEPEYKAFGALKLKVRSDLSPEDIKYVPTSHEYIDNKGLLETIAQGIVNNIPVLMEGETGTGKTSAVRYLASQCNVPYRRLNLNGSTTVDEFVGKVMLDKEGTYWTDGVLIDAMRKGHWIVLDEINAALPEILFVLHSLLDDDGYVVLAEKDGEVVRPHPDFRVFATMNPSDAGYSGTKDLNTAFLDRFMVISVEFPTLAQERKMVQKRLPNRSFVTDAMLTNMVKYAQEMRTAYKKGAQEFLLSPRGTLQWALLTEKFKDIHKSAEVSLVNKAPREEREGIRDVLKLRFGMGLYDYIDQTQKGQVYDVGDNIVLAITQEEYQEKTGEVIVGDFVGLYEVMEKHEPPVREGEKQTAPDPERIGYKLKCLGKNQKKDVFSTDTKTSIIVGRIPSAQYHGDNV